MTKKLRVWRCSFRLDKWRLLQDEVPPTGESWEIAARAQKKMRKWKKCKKTIGLLLAGSVLARGVILGKAGLLYTAMSIAMSCANEGKRGQMGAGQTKQGAPPQSAERRGQAAASEARSALHRHNRRYFDDRSDITMQFSSCEWISEMAA